MTNGNDYDYRLTDECLLENASRILGDHGFEVRVGETFLSLPRDAELSVVAKAEPRDNLDPRVASLGGRVAVTGADGGKILLFIEMVVDSDLTLSRYLFELPE